MVRRGVTSKLSLDGNGGGIDGSGRLVVNGGGRIKSSSPCFGGAFAPDPNILVHSACESVQSPLVNQSIDRSLCNFAGLGIVEEAGHQSHRLFLLSLPPHLTSFRLWTFSSPVTYHLLFLAEPIFLFPPSVCLYSCHLFIVAR